VSDSCSGRATAETSAHGSPLLHGIPPVTSGLRARYDAVSGAPGSSNISAIADRLAGNEFDPAAWAEELTDLAWLRPAVRRQLRALLG
jgi:hypothetical protein